MSTTWGTTYFVNELAARRYYSYYGISKAGVANKINKNEIHIGKPPLEPGEELLIIDDGTRYAIKTL